MCLVATMIDTFAHNFDSPGYLTAKIPGDLMQQLTAEIETIKKNNFEGYVSADQQLAGHLAHQLDFPQGIEILDGFVKYMAFEYNNRFDYQNISQRDFKDKPLELKHLWVNFQKKHDFNPVHDHHGVFSFVIWHTIPYDFREEVQRYKNGTQMSCASAFEFVYNDSLGNICTQALPISKEWEGVICLFPARLKHTVNPFYTSDEYRITIAGNLDFTD